jgi:CRP-like cAMP-binding protein
LSKRKILPIGKTLFLTGDSVSNMFLVKEGSIAYRVGNQKILSMTAGDYFGIEDLFLEKRFFSAFCES